MKYDIIVIGSGPGGYAAATRAASLGMKTAIVEREDWGGVCLNRGCIPTKALLKSAQVLEYTRRGEEFGIHAGQPAVNFQAVIARSREIAANMSRGVQFMLERGGVEQIRGHARLTEERNVEVQTPGGILLLEAPRVILATGSHSRELASLESEKERVISYREALTLDHVPSSLLVVGSGAIGSELAYFYRIMGARVILVEYMPHILPLEDEEVSRHLARAFKKAGIEVLTTTTFAGAETIGDKIQARVRDKKDRTTTRDVELILTAVGVAPNLENLGLESLCLATEKGRLVVDSRYCTSAEGIYAIGDITPGPTLAHVATAEAIACVDQIAGLPHAPVDYTAVPSCTYTTPEVASVGLTETQAVYSRYDIRVGKAQLTASGKANAAGDAEGFVKLIFNAADYKLLGAHLLGMNVTEMIAELALAKKQGATAFDLATTLHPHPTISESIMEAALDVVRQSRR